MTDDLGKRMIAYRARHNMSQEELAQKAKLSVMTVNFAENGTRTISKLTRWKIELAIKEGEKDAI